MADMTVATFCDGGCAVVVVVVVMVVAVLMGLEKMNEATDACSAADMLDLACLCWVGSVTDVCCGGVVEWEWDEEVMTECALMGNEERSLCVRLRGMT